MTEKALQMEYNMGNNMSVAVLDTPTDPTPAWRPSLTKSIPVSNGKYTALVDDADYERVAERSWYFSRGYAMQNVSGAADRTHRLMHRFILNAQVGDEVDHIDGNRLNNVRSNFRLTDRRGNAKNTGKRTLVNGKAPSSSYKGVSWDAANNKWAACITCNYKAIRLGRFRSEIEAALAYDRAAIEYHGDYARVNFPHQVDMPLLDADVQLDPAGFWVAHIKGCFVDGPTAKGHTPDEAARNLRTAVLEEMVVDR